MPAFSDIQHLNVETLSFALTLREENDPNKELFDKMTDEERELLGDNGKRKKGGKAPCKNKSCVAEEVTQKLGILEKARLSKELSGLTTEYDELAEEVDESLKRNQTTLNENSDLQSTYEGLLPDRLAIEKELKIIQGEKRSLSHAITKAQKLLKQMKAKEEKRNASKQLSISQASVSSLEASDLEILPRDKMKGSKKHSGTLKFLPQSGHIVWSCCMMQDDEADGCLDDQSIGVKSTLVMRRSDSYRPYTTLPKMKESDYVPWKRTTQPAIPPVWPPLHDYDRPRTANELVPKKPSLGESMRMGAICSSPIARAQKEQIFQRSCGHYTAHDGNCGCGMGSTFAQGATKMRSSRFATVNGGEFLRESNDLMKQSTGGPIHSRPSTVNSTTGRSTRPKSSGASYGMVRLSRVQGNKRTGVNKKLSMFSGMHLTNACTTNMTNPAY